MIFDNEPFVYIDPPKSLPGAGFILSTELPFYVGKVIKMKPEEAKEFMIKTKKLFVFCKGYSIAILEVDSLLEDGFQNHENLEGMADFYLNYRIIPNAGRYKRYKL